MAAKTAIAVKKQPRELTEEEILKAPEKDYMNEAQLAFFKQQLLELRDQLLQQRRRHRRAPARERNHDRPFGPRDARGGIHARAAHARPRAQAFEEGREVAAA